MLTLGVDKSTPKRGQRRTRKSAYGVCGSWLVCARWRWTDGEEVFTACMDDGDRLHIIFVYLWEMEAVMEAMGGIYSHSKHLAERLLAEAVFKNGKSRIWVHGLIRPHVVEKKVVGFDEQPAERLPKIVAPWKSGGIKDQGQELPTKIFKL